MNQYSKTTTTYSNFIGEKRFKFLVQYLMSSESGLLLCASEFYLKKWFYLRSNEIEQRFFCDLVSGKSV